jgi:general stress protein 26
MGKVLDYEHEKGLVLKFLEGKHAITLATSLGDRVTARTVSFANDGLAILFMSWAHHTKCVQIRVNPRVALCRDNVQIEGIADCMG